ncbi:MAG: nucleotidyl transferase AbiEii/AbiGii toxin family protein [Candidatus Levybacteria bacterium]|nr:nucleotidyl transferase AbiEii/AbiGii toxin family protein [Candidatus Levybacteria bacterium]
MFTKTLLPDTIRALKLVSNISIVKKSYLAGGTALALQIGHRISVDFDFFTPLVFDEKTLSGELSRLPEYKETGMAWRTVWGKIVNTKFSLFYYQYPLIKKTIPFEGIQMLSKEDIAAMKIHAMEDRGTKRDFIDLYFLTKEFTMEQMLTFYDQKYGTLEDHLYSILRSMNYFVDADIDRMPEMLIKIDWEKVKEYFKKETRRLTEKKLKI